jgi:hypothetical protein
MMRGAGEGLPFPALLTFVVDVESCMEGYFVMMGILPALWLCFS